MSQQIVSARVDNGKVILLNEQGGTSKQFGSTYAVAAVCGDDLVVVSDSGTVDLYAIEGGTRPSYKRGMGSSPGPVSIQLGTGLNFSIQRSNGQTDVYAGGSKARTTGTPNYGTKSTSSNTSEKESTPSCSNDDSGGGSLYVSDSFMAGIGRRCKACFTEPSTGPWADVVLWIAGVASVAAAIVVGMDSSFVAGIVAGAMTFAGGYFLRHGWARCLVRSHYGLPAFIAAWVIFSYYPTVGGWLLFGSILLWFWPLWPLMAIIVVLIGAIAAGLGKSCKTHGT